MYAQLNINLTEENTLNWYNEIERFKDRIDLSYKNVVIFY